MQRLEVRGAVRPIYGSLGVKRLRKLEDTDTERRSTRSHSMDISFRKWLLTCRKIDLVLMNKLKRYWVSFYTQFNMIDS